MSARMENESFEQYKARLKHEKLMQKAQLRGTRCMHVTNEKNRERDREDENTQPNFIKVHTQINDIFAFVSQLGITNDNYERVKSEYFKNKSTLTVREMRKTRDALVDAIKPSLPARDYAQ